MDGASLKFLAGSKNSGRSLSADIADRGWAYPTSGEMVLLPTLTAKPNARVQYGSSAAHFGLRHFWR